MGRSEQALAILIPSAGIVRANDTLSARHKIQTLDQLGRIYYGIGRFAEAASVFIDALDIWEALGPIGSPTHFDTEHEYVRTLMSLQRYDEAESRLRMRREQFSTAFGENDERTLQVIAALEELNRTRTDDTEN